MRPDPVNSLPARLRPKVPAVFAPEPPASLAARLVALDRTVFEAVAARRWPGADRVLPKLSRSANHGLLWGAVAAGLAVTGSPRARRPAVRALASGGLAAAPKKTLGTRSVPRLRRGR
ncbi:phosphoesterase, partial [Streptomyces albidoflavus]